MTQGVQKIHAELEAFFEKHYYSEDFELQASIKAWRDGLGGDEQAAFDQAVLDRLNDDPSILNITICTRLELPAAIPILVDLLNREEEASQRSRTIMAALQNYQEDVVFSTIERFMDSDQEREALRILSKLNLQRAKRYVIQAMFRDGLEDECLHLFHQAGKRIGLQPLIEELKGWGEENPGRFRKRLKKSCEANRLLIILSPGMRYG